MYSITSFFVRALELQTERFEQLQEEKNTQLKIGDG